jgi:hypothetical protein
MDMSLNGVRQVNTEAGNTSDRGIYVDDTAPDNVSTTHPEPGQDALVSYVVVAPKRA